MQIEAWKPYTSKRPEPFIWTMPKDTMALEKDSGCIFMRSGINYDLASHVAHTRISMPFLPIPVQSLYDIA